METKDIQELINFIAQSGLDEVNIETADLKINVKRYGQTPTVTTVAAPPASASSAAVPVSHIPAPPPAAVAGPVTPPAPSTESANYITIKSPMIGTFYRSSGPTSGTFVEIGDDVKPGKVVCIIEAMRLFNEIESEVTGRIVKVLVENATPVEYDQPLFLVEPV